MELIVRCSTVCLPEAACAMHRAEWWPSQQSPSCGVFCVGHADMPRHAPCPVQAVQYVGVHSPCYGHVECGGALGGSLSAAPRQC